MTDEIFKVPDTVSGPRDSSCKCPEMERYRNLETSFPEDLVGENVAMKFQRKMENLA